MKNNKETLMAFKRGFLFKQVDYIVWSMLTCGFIIGFLTAIFL